MTGDLWMPKYMFTGHNKSSPTLNIDPPTVPGMSVTGRQWEYLP